VVIRGAIEPCGHGPVTNRPSRLRKNYFDTRELQWSARVAQQENTPAGCSKRPSSKAAASEEPEAYPLGYVEGLNDARTLLADFFSILLGLFDLDDRLALIRSAI